MCMAKALWLAGWLAACSYSTRMHARCASGRPQSERPRHEPAIAGASAQQHLRRFSTRWRLRVSEWPAVPPDEQRCSSSSAVQICRFKARALLQQALRVAVPSPSADLQNSGASAAAACASSGRPVAKCRFAEFRRERCCSRHCEWPSRCQVKICRIQARALLQQALRVAVPLPSADVSHDRSCSLRLLRPN
ncbi:hypothetical protein BHM03_00062571 [Ensete ventricosum]|nr:hypothetical protein BHM03_00062571 [Ensete ventricosum]